MVQLEGTGVALANAAAPFLPVFLVRLGATNFQVGLLSAMPAFTGLLLSVAVGSWLLSQHSVAPWYARTRTLSILAYGLTGIITLLLPPSLAVPTVLIIWALATLPQVIVNITFSVVMNAVAGPKLRYDLLGRRWSMMGLITAVGIAVTGQVLERVRFPFNYQIAFMVLSLGGLVSLFFAARLRLPDYSIQNAPPHSARDQWRAFGSLLRGQPAFVSVASKRFLYMAGVTLAGPIIPLYYVRVAHADDGAIGLITTVQTLTLLIGYRLWTRLSQRRGLRAVLLLTTLALAVYPALMASTRAHTLELKVGVLDPLQDADTIRRIRDAIGPDLAIRIDANNAWSVESAVRTLNIMQESDLANAEEPCRGLTALARVRSRVSTPVSTHCADVAVVAGLGAADNIVFDLPSEGGIDSVREAAAEAEAAGLGVWMRSTGELGIGTAAILHLAAATPAMTHANQTVLHMLADDVVTKPLRIREGYVDVPDGPGLGVELDEEKVKTYARLHAEEGTYWFWGPRHQPGWTPPRTW